MSFKKISLILIAAFFIVLLFLGFKLYKQTKSGLLPIATSSPVPAPTMVNNKVKYPEDFTIVLLGDSMTERLGNSDEIRSYLSKYYPQKTVEVLNYGFGSTNILSVPQRLTQHTQHGRDFRPILDIDFNLIIIESFANNPLSQYPLAQGLAIQTQTLDQIVDLIKKSNPNAKIAFMATISPNSKSYALKEVDLTPQKRAEWAAERVAYLKNHINYANSHNIPLINVYQKSLDKNGDGNPIYIDSTDNIHPSPSGIYLISQEIADTIYKYKWLEN